MWVQFLQMQVWWLVSDQGLVSVFDIGEVATGMAAFDEQVLRDWAAAKGMQGHGTAQIGASECCYTMWSLGAELLAVRIDPRVFESYLEYGATTSPGWGQGSCPTSAWRDSRRGPRRRDPRPARRSMASQGWTKRGSSGPSCPRRTPSSALSSSSGKTCPDRTR